VSVDSPGPGADAQYFYDENNDLTEVRLTDPADVTHVQLRRFDYDRLGRLRVAYNPESGTTEYISYDARGNLLSYKDARQNTFNLAYDAADRLLTRKLGTLLLVQNVYDSESGLSSGASAGRLVHQNSFKSAGGISQFVSSVQYGFGASDSSTPCTAGSGYTGLNGRLSWTRTQVMPWSTSVQVDYCQDVLGVDSTIGYPYVYGSGRTRTKLASTFWNGYLGELHDEGHNLQYAKTISYASGGVPREIRRGDNERDVTYLDIRNRPVGFEAFGLQTSYGDPVPCDPPPGGGEGQVMVPWEWCGDPPISSEEVLNWYSGGYTYDMAGNVKSIGAEQYYYDSVSRLVHASMPVGGSTHILDFTYDGFGNMTKQSRSTSGSSQYSGERQYAIDPLTNRLFSTTWTNGIGSPIDYTFDDNGNMTADGSRGLVFDAENRLREVMDPERGRIGNYDYDASGFRVRSEVDGAEIFYFRDASGQVLSEFQRPLGTGGDPVWNKDYVYLFGKSFALVKNDVPTTPKLPWITPISSTSLTLNWAPTGDQDILGYSIERTYKKCSTCTATTGTISVPASPLHWTDSFLNPSSTGTSALLKYVVRAMDTAGNLSDPSPMITVYPGPSLNPPAPPSIIVTPGDRAVTITWAATAPLHTDLQGYYVERNSSAHPAWERLNDYALTTREYVDTLLANGTQYCYRVYAVDNCNRPGSPTSSACTSPIDNAAPGKLTGVTAEADRLPGTIRVRWGRGLDSDIATYRVYRSSDPSSIGTQFQDVSGQGQGMVFEATDTDLTRGDYCYRVSALDLTHESSPSEPACARPRYSGPPAPVSLSATYNVDPNGTPSPEFCNVSAESDDIIQVLVDWSLSPSQALNGSHFHIYRKSANDTLYTMLGTVDYDGRSTPYEFKDKAITEGSYSYFVATYEFVAPSWEESAGSLEVSMAHAFPSSATVRDVRVTDSRDYYSTGNKESRWTIVSWSRVPEPDLVGYNVYRMCNFAGCTEHAGSATRTDVASCEPVWVRLNMIPVLPTNRVYEDSDVGGLGGCFLYAVRPVGPDQVEGPITRVVEADLTPGQVAAVAPVHCSAPLTIGDDSLPMPVGHNLPNPPYWFYPTVNSISVDTLLNGPNGVNLQAHTGTPGATPPAPTGVHLSLDLKPAWVSPELADVTIARISWSMPSAPINLLGFHVEAARSSSGPWVRLTRSPVAWWERHYTAQGLGAIPSCNASQPNCWQFRVLSVDTDSAESSATAAAENPSCSAPPPAPQNLHAVTIGSGLNVRAQLTWDPSLGASSYVIYRMVIVGGSGGNPYFYRTQIQAGTTFEEWGDPAQDPYPAPWVCPNMNCPYLLPEGCSRNYLDVYYVTALGSTGTESLRSNLVFWKAGGPSDGYDDARLSPPSWALPATDAQDELLACMQPAPPVNDRASTGGDNSYTPAQPSREPHTLQPSPMVRLGSIADPPWSVLNLHTDHLGTVRLVTSNATTLPVSRHDYFPFGEEIAPQTSYNTHQYTGHERDRESGLDYMLARYYGDSLPRFLSADPASGSPHDPQSWNRFAYVRNNPLVLIDPTGMYWAPGTPMPILPGDPNGCTMCILVVDPLAPADWQSRAMAQLSVLKQSNPRIAAMIKQLEDSDNVHTLTPSSGGGSLTKALDEEASYNGTGSGSTIYFNVDQFDSDDTPSYPFAVLAHELSHAEDIDRGRMDRVDSTNRHRVSEEKAVRMENLANQSVGSGLSPKTFYQGDWYYVPQIRVAFPTSVPPQW
jgi:RHS repeat-associated protein